MRSTATEKVRTRLLLIESDPWDAGLVQEAIEELEERPHENLLARPLDLFLAETLTEAVDSLQKHTYDLILLDPGTIVAPDSQNGLHSYFQVREPAPDTPIVILASREDESLALSAMREGAAGYLLKEDLDCLPLARALRAALERQQALVARSRMPGTDELTGLSSKAGFLYLGEMAVRLSARWNKPARLSIVHLTNFSRMQNAFGSQARDLALLETADLLRDIFPDADLLARTGTQQFAALSLIPEVSDEPLDSRVAAWVDARTGRTTGSAVLEYACHEVMLDPDVATLAEALREPALAAAHVSQ